MQDPETRKKILLLGVIFVALFGIIVISYYFFSKQQSPSAVVTERPKNSLPEGEDRPPCLGFVSFGVGCRDGNDEANGTASSSTEVLPGSKQPLVQVWNKPATGGQFVDFVSVQEITATTTKKIKPKTKNGTTTEEVITITKLVYSTSTILMFVDRTTGYVYGYNLETDTPYQITNTTVPGVYDAYIFNGGKKVLMRYLDTDRKTIVSIISTIPAVKEGSDPQPLSDTVLLPKNVTSVAESVSSSKISYLVAKDGGSTIYTMTPKGITSVSSPFSEWNLTYGGEQLYAASKPSAYIEGSVVKVPGFSRMDSGRTGLVSVVALDGKMLSSMWSSSGLTTFVSENGNTKISSVKTLAPKCTWLHKSPVLVCGVPSTLPVADQGLPDDWYQGRTLFNDSLYFIDGKTAVSYSLYSFEEKYGGMDTYHFSLSKNDENIAFLRKQDGTLWILKTALLVQENN